MPLGNSDIVQVGDSVFAVGNPQGLEGTFSQGIISSIRQIGTETLLQLTAPISPGSSGGPVLNSQGEVIGVSVATFRGGQNLNFAIPAKYLRELLTRSGSAVPLTRAKRATSEGSILHDLGGRSSEGLEGRHFAWKYRYIEGGSYSFSIRNKLNHNVRNVYCLVVFYGKGGEPIEIDFVTLRDTVPAGLAKRVMSSVDGSVQRFVKTVDFRILNFEVLQ